MIISLLNHIIAQLKLMFLACTRRFDQIDASLTAQSLALANLTRLVTAMQADITVILAAVTPLPAVRLVFTTILEGKITIGATTMIITSTQKFTASITPVDAKGNPAAVDGTPVWASSDPTVLAVNPAADGLSAECLAVGPLGNAQVAVTADADMGTGITSITGVLDVQVLAGQAVSLSVSATAPVEQ